MLRSDWRGGRVFQAGRAGRKGESTRLLTFSLHINLYLSTKLNHYHPLCRSSLVISYRHSRLKKTKTELLIPSPACSALSSCVCKWQHLPAGSTELVSWSDFELLLLCPSHPTISKSSCLPLPT